MIFISLGVLFIIIVIILIKTHVFSTRYLKVEKIELEEIVIPDAIKRLSKAIRLKTISSQEDSKMELKPFLDFQILLEKSYPAIHNNLKKEVINQYSLLYKWPGKNPKLEPIALLAHFDVVPVEPGTQDEWTFEPFSGEVADGFVWGRGTLDMKGSLMAIMEAIEKLLTNGFSPERTIYLAFGHDEELGGTQGAEQIMACLKKQGVQLSYTLDEGKSVLNKEISPSKKILAVIGIAEKGYLTLKLSATGLGGHPSVPPFKTSIGMLCKAMNRIEKKRMSATLTEPVDAFYHYIGPDMTFYKKMLFANKWIFKHFILFILGKSENTNAMIRTTSAPTMMLSGVKENVLPSKAHLLINFRILPGDTIKKVVEHIKKVIDDDAITIEIFKNIISEPSPISSTDSNGFFNIQKTICQVFPDATVSPSLVLGTTDSRHYIEVSRDRYHFTPFVFGSKDSSRIHGTNERISIKGYIRAIQYYIQLLKNSAEIK